MRFHVVVRRLAPLALFSLALVASGLLLPAGAAAQSSLRGSRPNIVLVMTDDQGYAQLGKHGHPWIETPNLDKLHDASVRFDRFLVSPTCSPTRAAIMTGRHPMKNGITHTINERERMTLKATILPQVLKSAGYTTGIFGKWHLGDEDPYQPHNRGFDEAFIHGAGGIGQAYKCSCADAPGNKYFDPAIKHNGSFVKTEGYCTDLFFTAAMGWIKQAKSGDAPFFAYITTNAPHGPFIAPQKNTDRFKQLGFQDRTAGFYGMIENIDENMGRLVGQLEAWGLMENTVLIFMSDNGTTGNGAGNGSRKGVLGERDGKPLKIFNAGMKGMKGSPDEGGVRVPFFVRWDGKLKAGRQIDSLAAHIDILPTLAELADAKLPPEQVEGVSLAPHLVEGEGAAEDRLLFTHTGRWAVGADPDKSQYNRFAVRSQQYRLVGNALFDMQADPGQAEDVSGQHPQVVKRMRSAFDKFWSQTRPLMVNEGVPMSPTRPFHVQFAKQQAAGGIPAWKPPQLD